MKKVSFKRLLVVSVLAAIVFSFASCSKKECVCTRSDGEVITVPFIQEKKRCNDAFPANPNIKCVWK